ASELPLKENITLSTALLKECAKNDIILEVEAGVVGGEEDGIDHSDKPAEKLYTTPEDMLAAYEALNGLGRDMFAATFGNVHGPGLRRPAVDREDDLRQSLIRIQKSPRAANGSM